MSLEVHKATLQDAETLKTILEEGRVFKHSQGDDAWGEEPFSINEVSEMIKAGDLYVAELDGKVVGSVILIWEDERTWGAKGTNGKAGYIHYLVTSNAVRGQGIGEQIINWAANQARQADKQYLRLDCRKENKKLYAYYMSLGFDVTDITTQDNHSTVLFERSV